MLRYMIMVNKNPINMINLIPLANWFNCFFFFMLKTRRARNAEGKTIKIKMYIMLRVSNSIQQSERRYRNQANTKRVTKLIKSRLDTVLADRLPKRMGRVWAPA